MEANRAIILAAGRGSRLVDDGPLPKPLVSVSGEPLLSRILQTLSMEGVLDAVIITGYKGDLLEKTVRSWKHLSHMDLHFVRNDEWQKSNGVSLLKAKDWIDGHTLLSMSDHLFSPQLVASVQSYGMASESSVLGVDRKIDRVFDIDDATKVLCNGKGILNIGKEIDDYDAIDTGLFKISPSLTDTLWEIYAQRGDCSLSDGVRLLAQRGLMEYCDVGDAFWVDVDTPDAQRFAEMMLRLLGNRLEGLMLPMVATNPGLTPLLEADVANAC